MDVYSAIPLRYGNHRCLNHEEMGLKWNFERKLTTKGSGFSDSNRGWDQQERGCFYETMEDMTVRITGTYTLIEHGNELSGRFPSSGS